MVRQKKTCKEKNSQAATLVAIFGGLRIPSRQQLEQLTHGVNKRDRLQRHTQIEHPRTRLDAECGGGIFGQSSRAPSDGGSATKGTGVWYASPLSRGATANFARLLSQWVHNQFY